MIKITDVDVIKPYVLSLKFSDGFCGIVDLTDTFQKRPYCIVKKFDEFSLTGGALSWGELDLSADFLRNLAQGEFQGISPDPSRAEDIKQILQDALWQAIEENRPDIFQGAIAMLVEKYGHANVIRQAGIKSRTSAYRSLTGGASPKLDTLIKLGHAALDIAKTA